MVMDDTRQKFPCCAAADRAGAATEIVTFVTGALALIPRLASGKVAHAKAGRIHHSGGPVGRETLGNQIVDGLPDPQFVHVLPPHFVFHKEKHSIIRVSALP